MIEEALIVKLKGASSVTSLVGTGTNARIGTGLMSPTHARPYVYIQVPQSENPVTMSGATTLHRATVQIVSCANTRTQAQTLASAVLTTLNGFNGSVSTTASGTVRVKGVFHQADQDDEQGPEPGKEGGEPFLALREFLICYAAS